MPENVPGYFVWQVPGKAVSVQLNLEMIDRLSTVVMTGFGAIPRRGAEVGGILVGSIDGSVVHIDEFEAVPCSYKRGPSYLLSEADSAAFGEAWEKWKPRPGKTQYAVGYYRSNTRDQAALSEEDRGICEKYFPPPSNVMLFIKPYASKTSSAGFITYENGKLEDASALEFPFRRHEIEGTAAPARRPLGEPRPDHPPRERRPDHRPEPRQESDYQPAAPPVRAINESRYMPDQGYTPPPPLHAEMERPYNAGTDSRSRSRGWAWIPLSFIFLLLGVFLGFQMALSIYPSNARPKLAPGEDPFTLGLSVTHADENLHVKWERQAPAIRAAERGLLTIKDGEYNKQVQLDTIQLQNGSVIYHKLSNRVQFKVEVYPKDNVTVSELVEWKQ